jgi:hypothetical protein
LFIKPKERASLAESFDPIEHSSNALAIPTVLGRKKDEPESGTKPILIKTSINEASSEATMISHANAMEHPAPAATPFNRHTIGLGKLRIDRIIGLYRLCNESRKERLVDPTGAFRS